MSITDEQKKQLIGIVLSAIISTVIMVATLYGYDVNVARPPQPPEEGEIGAQSTLAGGVDCKSSSANCVKSRYGRNIIVYSDSGSTQKFKVTGSTGVIGLVDGSVSAPVLGFASDTDTGFYRIGANNLGVALGGSKVLDVQTGGLSVTGNLTGTLGTTNQSNVTNLGTQTYFTATNATITTGAVTTETVTSLTATTGAITNGTVTTATVTSLSLDSGTFSGAFRSGTSATYTSGAAITHGYSVTPTACLVFPQRDVTETVTLGATTFSSDRATQASPIYWICGK